MTIHSAKGLEFKHLVIAGVEEELFPSPMSVDNPKDLEEERRLFYVALTRAEKSVLITYAASRYKWGIQNSCSPSRFIKEIEPETLELPPDFYPVLPGQAPGSGMHTHIPPGRVQPAGRKFVPGAQAMRSVDPATPAASSEVARDFTPSDPGMIQVGSRVEHPRFGIGEVHQMEGSGSNIKATVQFPIGTKQLLLKFAKLRVVK
jgi:DNA helicase-2/ATP-dependent DNA helicase PcrA